MSDIVLIEWFNAHYYKVTVDGKTHYLPSVTTKLGVIDKPNLARWRGDLGNREADLRLYDAGLRGTRIHWAYETALKGGAVLYDPWKNPVYTKEGIAELEKAHGAVAILRTQEEMWDICKLEEQFKRLNPRVVGVEEKVWDVENNDAGTIDNILEIKEGEYMISGNKPLHLPGGIYINDLKTGSYVDEGVWFQLAPYAFMYEKIHGVQIAGALVTHTGSSMKTGIPGLKTMVRDRDTLLNIDYKYYRHASALWEGKHAGEEPHTFQFPSMITMKPKEIAHVI